jgi:hypothetical protein
MAGSERTERERRRMAAEHMRGMFADLAPGRSLSEELAAARRFRAEMDAARRLDLITELRASDELILDRRIEVWSEEMARIEGELRAVGRARGGRD